MLRTAYLLTGHAQDAEDLLQTTSVKVVPQWRWVRDDPEPDVRRVLVNENVSRWHRRRRRSTDELPETLAAEADVVELMAVRDALASLAPRQRAVLPGGDVDDSAVDERASGDSAGQLGSRR